MRRILTHFLKAHILGSGIGAEVCSVFSAQNLPLILLFEVSARLGTETVCVQCCEQGMTPETLSLGIQECRMAARAVKSENMTS
uniref:Uncharacterized protein n=1 Tax=Mus spicilegus TaxID=10103 RepID=A0A8C6GJ27_MUSSI